MRQHHKTLTPTELVMLQLKPGFRDVRAHILAGDDVTAFKVWLQNIVRIAKQFAAAEKDDI